MNQLSLLNITQKPNVEELSRYQDLENLVKTVFMDEHVSDLELKVLGDIDALLVAEFYVAQESLNKMDQNSPMYAAAKELVTHLYRCRMLIDKAHDKAKVYNDLSHFEKERLKAAEMAKSSVQKETLSLSNIGEKGMALMMGLMTPEQRIQAEQSFAKKQVRALSVAEREAIEQRVMAAIQSIRAGQTNAMQLNRILDLGRERA